MREYQTWEVFKALEENPELKFEHTRGGRKYILGTTDAGYFTQTGETEEKGKVGYYELPNGLTFFHNVGIGAKWTLVPQSITAEEAMTALREGKCVKVECKDCGGTSECCIFHKNDFSTEICVSAIIDGVWSIEEE